MAFLYVFFSAILGTGLHISAVHFIAEHYQLTAETAYNNDAEDGMDTFSYYGPINWVLFNGGYHIEHHDFIRVPCTRLPQVKAIAPEFYDTLPQVHSYTDVLMRFIFNHPGLWQRVKRDIKTLTAPAPEPMPKKKN